MASLLLQINTSNIHLLYIESPKPLAELPGVESAISQISNYRLGDCSYLIYAPDIHACTSRLTCRYRHLEQDLDEDRTKTLKKSLETIWKKSNSSFLRSPTHLRTNLTYIVPVEEEAGSSLHETNLIVAGSILGDCLNI